MPETGGPDAQGGGSAGEATPGRDQKHRRRTRAPTGGLLLGRPSSRKGDY